MIVHIVYSASIKIHWPGWLHCSG